MREIITPSVADIANGPDKHKCSLLLRLWCEQPSRGKEILPVLMQFTERCPSDVRPDRSDLPRALAEFRKWRLAGTEGGINWLWAEYGRRHGPGMHSLVDVLQDAFGKFVERFGLPDREEAETLLLVLQCSEEVGSGKWREALTTKPSCMNGLIVGFPGSCLATPLTSTKRGTLAS